MNDELPSGIALVHSSEPAEDTSPSLPSTRVIARVAAYYGELTARGCKPLDPDMWKKQGLTQRDATARPPATMITYAKSGARRALFDKRERVSEGKKIRELDGVWLTRDLAGKDLPAPCPMFPGHARAANGDKGLPLHVTDREDIALALAISAAGVIAVAPGASLFANETAVDDRTPDLPRPLHPDCGGSIPLGHRDLVFIFEDRDHAIRIARGLRQGEAHTGKVFYVETSVVLAEIDSGISQGLSGEALHLHTRTAPQNAKVDITPTVTSGHPGSVGARVMPWLLHNLPSDVRDLLWPVPEGGGTSWENLDWAISKQGAVLGVFRDQKGEELTLNKPALALRTPIYITRRLSSTEGEYLELRWAEAKDKGHVGMSKVIDAEHVLCSSGRALTKAGIPIGDAKRASQYFNAFMVANPNIPTVTLHMQAGWVQTAQGMQFILPESRILGHEMHPDVLRGVVRQGDREMHWQLMKDLWEATHPINRILQLLPHASPLLAALKVPGSVFGLVDDTSRGKSVLLESVTRQYGWDGGDYAIDASVPPTTAFLERVVQRANGLMNVIDEFHKIPNSPKEMYGKSGLTRQEVAYFLTNGQRKGRSNAAGGIDATTERIYSYSLVAGEAKHITALDRLSQMEGARVRMIALPLVGYSDEFLAKYGSLGGFMRRIRKVKGHIGYEVLEAMAREINTRGLEVMQEEFEALTAYVTDFFTRKGAVSAASLRRASMFTAVVYIELLMARWFSHRGMFSPIRESTAGIQALESEYGPLLMLTDETHEGAGDDSSISDILLEALQRDRTLIQAFRYEERPNPRPLARVEMHKRAEYRGLRFYPKALFDLLKRHELTELVARELLTKSNDFILQPHKKGAPTLLHRSNGGQWIVPVAGFGWRLLMATPGQQEEIATDPYYESRATFEELFETRLKAGMPEYAALRDALRDHWRGTKDGMPYGTLEERLRARDARAWGALVLPMLDRLQDKPGFDPALLGWEKLLQEIT